MNGFSIASTVVCIVIDLSNPGNAIDSLQFWISAVKEHTQRALDELQKSNAQVFQQVQDRANEKWEKHEDRAKIKPNLIPIIVIGAKFDIYANSYESVKKK